MKLLVLDKSLISLDGGHICFVHDSEEDSRFGEYPVNYKSLGENWYEMKIIIPQDVKIGSYHLYILNVFDIYGNGFSELPEQLQFLVQIYVSH